MRKTSTAAPRQLFSTTAACRSATCAAVFAALACASAGAEELAMRVVPEVARPGAPLEGKPAKMPAAARQAGISGCVDLSYSIGWRGRVTDARVTAVHQTEAGKDVGFADAALKSLNSRRYGKTRLGDATISVVDVKETMDFSLAGDGSDLPQACSDEADDVQYVISAEKLPGGRDAFQPVELAAPRRPSANGEELLTGCVTVRYRVGTDGLVHDPEIVQLVQSNGEKNGKLDLHALEALQAFRYQPPMLRGEPLVVTDVEHRFIYDLQIDDRLFAAPAACQE